jgi:NADPH:quinone reductase-like Zn-dependent oxidoreductase
MKALALVSDTAETPTRATKMQAIVQEEYGSPDKLELREVDKPVVGDDDVLVRVEAAAVNALDWRVMRGLPYLVRMSEGRRRPENPIRGVDLAGRVEAVGKNVTEFKPGDEVFGERSRAFAEYVLGKEEHFADKPASLTFEEAATLGCAALTALQGLRDKAEVKPGQKVLINGAGGGVGTFSVQIAKALGAEVTAVCGPHNVEMVRSIGADGVIDYSREDFTKSKERYDVVFDNAGNRSLRRLRRILTPSGTLVFVGAPHFRFFAPLVRILRGVITSRFSEQRLLPFLATHSKEDLLVLKELVESGKVTPVIDRTYPLSETPEAIAYVEKGHARGKVVITV